MPNRPDRNVYLYGPVSVGKGFTGWKIREKFPEVPQIGMGEYFRSLRQVDQQFNTTYGTMMEKGLLLPGLIVFHHAKKLIEKIERASILVLDGAIRSVQQVNLFGGKSGLLCQDDVVCHISATYHTCHSRHVHRRKVSIGNIRDDDRAFSDRYNIYMNSRSEVINAMRRTGAKIVQIDGDAPLEVIADTVIALAIKK